MIVEVRGADFLNKGAELMLRAVPAWLNPMGIQVAATPRAGTYAERAGIGLLQVASHRYVRRDRAARLGRRAPDKLAGYLRNEYGIVLDRDVSAILDASGFAYTDQFPVEPSRETAQIAREARRQGKPYILLPQALGPFERADQCDAFREIAAHSSLIFAREATSYAHARAAGIDESRLRLAPDFTCLLSGTMPVDFVQSAQMAIVVPNQKMITHTDASVRERYVPFLTESVRLLRLLEFDVRLLVHERGDVGLCQEVARESRVDPPVLRYESALDLKGVIGTASLLVGSRFHALVSALSQGVPVVAAGWSHKYEELLSGYDAAESLVDPSWDGGRAIDRVRRVAEAALDPAWGAQLKARAEDQKRETTEMWDEVLRVLQGEPRL